MGDVESPARSSGQLYIPGHHHLFGGRWLAFETEAVGHEAFVHDAAVRDFRVFTVIDHGSAMTKTVGECVPHQPGVAYGPPVVGEADRTGLRHLAHV